MWHDPAFYILLSFLLFCAVVGLPAYRKFSAQLQERSKTVQRQIKEVRDLYEEAESLLEEQKKRHTETIEESKQLEKETKAKIRSLEKSHAESLLNLEEKNKTTIEKEVALLREHASKDIHNQLMQNIQKNIQWIVEERLTPDQKESMTSTLIETLPKSK